MMAKPFGKNETAILIHKKNHGQRLLHKKYSNSTQKIKTS